MFCHECDHALATGEPYVVTVYDVDENNIPTTQHPTCLTCAINLDWLFHGQTINIHGQEAA